MNEEDTSGYSSARTSPQASNEDLSCRKVCTLHKVRGRLKTLSIDSEDEEEEKISEFQPKVTPNESEPHKEWYHKLLTLKCEYRRGERGAFPPFPPPPLPSTMLAASRSHSVNRFEAVKKAAVGSTIDSPHTTSVHQTVHRFCPTDFSPLPPPHVFLSIIRTLAPHQYIDLTYALAGAVLLEIGVKIPERFPPLPPKIEPFRPDSDEDTTAAEMSSQSSSEGEYSDASEKTRYVESQKREKNRQRRAARKVRIVAKMLSPSHQENLKQNEEELTRPEIFARDHSYKCKTLANFIPSASSRRLPPLIPQFQTSPLPGFLIPHPVMLPLPPIIPPIMMMPFPAIRHTPKANSRPKPPVETKKTILMHRKCGSRRVFDMKTC